jgi:ABC-2 type transport system permease protein
MTQRQLTRARPPSATLPRDAERQESSATTSPARADLRQGINLTRELALTQFKLKYTGSVLGYVWSLAKPLMIFAIMYFVFDILLNAGAGQPSFPMQLLLGIVIWTFFAETTSTALSSVVANGNLIKKAYFPRHVIVLASTLSALMTFVINLVLVVIVGLFLGQMQIGLASLLILPLAVELYIAALGAGLLLSALYASYRDLGHLWEIALQLGFYGSAVVYPLTFKARLADVMAANPIAQTINDARHVLVSRTVPWTSTVVGWRFVIPLVIAVSTLALGWTVFQRMAPRFAETL